jgi:hypothetical protein
MEKVSRLHFEWKGRLLYSFLKAGDQIWTPPHRIGKWKDRLEKLLCANMRR